MLETVRQHVSVEAAKNIEIWLTEPKYSEYKAQLEAMIAEARWSELEDSFYSTIEFGTAGIRGATGIGSARISRVTIADATQALCEYVTSLDEDAKDRGVVIAYDTRLTSEEFSKLAACVCAGNGVKAYLFDGFRSTPELSFAVRFLGASAGIVISASHNPPIDNGFKAYLSDGAQLVAPHDKAVTERVRQTTETLRADYNTAVNDGLIELIGESVDVAYIEAVLSQASGTDRNLEIVYSPLHGAGQRNTLPVLLSAGFNVKTVDSQMTPDGNFPTVENNKPNPEERAANDLAVALMMAENADIAITNDPDADRIGVIARVGEEARYLSGNQTAVLATDYALSKMPKSATRPYIAKTIVTTDLMDAIAQKHGAAVYGDMLIGFKYIGELILSKERTDETFIIGAEESFGMLKGDYARDKDGAVGALVLAECAAELKTSGKTMFDRLIELYKEHGIYLERIDTIVCPGASGFEQMQRIMANLRSKPPLSVGSHQVSAVVDYQTLERTYADGRVERVDCNVSGNVIVLEFDDRRRRVTIRPSGTEPKLKLYSQWYEEASSSDLSEVEDQYDDMGVFLEGIARELEGMLLRS